MQTTKQGILFYLQYSKENATQKNQSRYNITKQLMDSVVVAVIYRNVSHHATVNSIMYSVIDQLLILHKLKKFISNPDTKPCQCHRKYHNKTWQC